MADFFEEAKRRYKGPFFYGWIIVGVGFLVYAIGYGARYSFSVYFPSLLEVFQWPRDATAAMLSFHFLAYGLTAPIAGFMVDRYGARKTMALGTALLVTGAAISSQGMVLWHYYLSFGVLMGIGLSLMGAVPFTKIIGNWFVRKRGVALGILFFGLGSGFLMYPLVAWFIERVGWSVTFLLEAAMVAVILLPLIAFFIRDHPEEMGLLPDGNVLPVAHSRDGESDALTALGETGTATDWTLMTAIKTSRFWAICFCAFSMWGITEQTLLAHHIAFAVDTGYSKFYASSVLSLFGIFRAFGGLASIISDRIGREMTLSISAVIGVSGIMLLLLIQNTSQSWMLILYSALFGLGTGMASPAIIASIVDIFQGKRAGPVIGFVLFVGAMGGAFGPWLGGYIYEASGSYLVAFLTSAFTFILACVFLWIAAPRRAVVLRDSRMIRT